MNIESREEELNIEINKLMTILVKNKFPDKVSHEYHWISVKNTQCYCNLCDQFMCPNTQKEYDRNKINKHAKFHLKNLLAFI